MVTAAEDDNIAVELHMVAASNTNDHIQEQDRIIFVIIGPSQYVTRRPHRPLTAPA